MLKRVLRIAGQLLSSTNEEAVGVQQFMGMNNENILRRNWHTASSSIRGQGIHPIVRISMREIAYTH